RERLLEYAVGRISPVGHGAVRSCPDRPYLRWNYLNSAGERVVRDNPGDFATAARQMCVAMLRYRAGDAAAPVEHLLPQRALERVAFRLREIRDPEAATRHRGWLDLIAQGEFGFCDANVNYVGKGMGSWKQLALGTTAERDGRGETFRFSPSFLHSDWKLFHD